jgi:hypothetical protein
LTIFVLEALGLDSTRDKKSNAIGFATVFLGIGAVLLVFALIFELQVLAFIGLGLTFWGAVLALARDGKYVDITLLDSTALSNYATIDRMITDLASKGRAYYIAAYPKDVFLPDYLKKLRDPVVFISDNFNEKMVVDDLASGKFFSSKTNGFFISSPGAAIMSQVESYLHLDLSKISINELADIFPKFLTETLNLTKNAQITLTSNGAQFKATGIVYNSLYTSETKPNCVNLLGCPVVSAVASSLAKVSGKTVVIKDQHATHGNNVTAILSYVEGEK